MTIRCCSRSGDCPPSRPRGRRGATILPFLYFDSNVFLCYSFLPCQGVAWRNIEKEFLKMILKYFTGNARMEVMILFTTEEIGEGDEIKIPEEKGLSFFSRRCAHQIWDDCLVCE